MLLRQRRFARDVSVSSITVADGGSLASPAAAGTTTTTLNESSSSSSEIVMAGDTQSEVNHLTSFQHTYDVIALEEARCKVKVLSQPAPTDGIYCPAVFGHWAGCFNYTRAGTKASVQCLPIDMFNTQEKSHLRCLRDGNWERTEAGNLMTNTSDCIKHIPLNHAEIDHWRPEFIPIYVYIIGASISFIFLVASLVIFFGFKQLRCERVIVHQNLFISLLLTNVFWVAYYLLVSFDGTVMVENPVWCQVLHVVAWYFSTCNFSWLFCEGLYLHIIMARALATGKTVIKLLVAAGWGIPVLLTICYTVARASEPGKTIDCWMKDDYLLYIFAVPIVISTLLNLAMLINLVRLLVTKLQQIPEAHQRKKAVKAALILVPLFGIQFLLFPVKPNGEKAHMAYLIFMAVITSTQGIFVSIIFCFCNGEVRSLLGRKWQQHTLMSGRSRKHGNFTSSTFADHYSVGDTASKSRNEPETVNGKETMELEPLASPCKKSRPSSRGDDSLKTEV